jgi:hypothetical protein
MNTNKIKTNSSNKTLSSQAKNVAGAAIEKTKEAVEGIKSVGNKITNAAQAGAAEVKKKVSNVSGSEQITGPITKWSAMTQEFLTANSAISKFVGFFLCLLLFIILFQIGMSFIKNMFGASYNPYIINGMVASDVLTVVSSNPNVEGSVPIYRSVDENQGLEFSWNVWFMINDAKSGITNNRIFSKGLIEQDNLNYTPISNGETEYFNVSPGLFISSMNNNNGAQLTLVMNTFDNSRNTIEKIQIPNIPIQKWICCSIRVQGKSVDIYINGLLKQRKNLINLPRQNYYDTYIGEDAGMKGYVSSLRYYGYAINYDEIQSLFASGPSLKMITTTTMPASSDYLSMNWYMAPYTN